MENTSTTSTTLPSATTRRIPVATTTPVYILVVWYAGLEKLESYMFYDRDRAIAEQKDSQACGDPTHLIEVVSPR